MATHDYVIANGTGAAVRSDLNDALAAIVSNNSGTSEPATTYAYQWWADTTNNALKIRNSANNAWITLRELDGTLLIEDGSASAPGLAFADDVNTGIFSPAADQIGFATGGAERLEIGSSEVVFNDPSNDVDFRVESNGNTHMLFVDAGNDRIGIGTSSPDSLLDVENSSGASEIQIKSLDASDCTLAFGDNADTDVGRIRYAHSADAMLFFTAANERARIDSSGRLLVGTTTEGRGGATDNLTIADSADCGITIRSGASNDGAIDFSDSTSGNGEFAGQILYDHGSNFMRFMTASSERARIDSSGRLLVGLTSSSASAASVLQGFAGSSTGQGILQLQVGKNNAATANNENLGSLRFANSDGSIGALVSAEADGQWASSDYPSRLTFHTTADNASSPTERVRIGSQGCINQTTNASDSDRFPDNGRNLFHSDIDDNVTMVIEHSGGSPYGLLLDFSDVAPDNNTNWFLLATDSSLTRFIVYSDGDVQNHDNSYSGISDQKLKQNIVDAGSQWDDLKDLRVRKFKFKSDVAAYGDEAKTLIGLVAQEAETVCPGLVKNNPDLDEEGNDLGTVTKSVRYSVLYMKAIKALQEAMDRIETLEAKVAALEAG